MGTHVTHLRCSSAVVLAVSVVLLLNAEVALSTPFCSHKRIFAFGDSLIDTGNFVSIAGDKPPGSALKEPPYGMTFFSKPTGRVCDGRVLVDFYAQAFNLPLLPPSVPEEASGQFATGANFAVYSASALPPKYFKSKYNLEINVPSHLELQINSFKKILARIAPGDVATRAVLNESLVLMGEIGGNDYNFWFMGDPKNPRDTAYLYIPVLDNIFYSVNKGVIDIGARAVVVPGNFPFGCVPAYLNAHRSDNKSDYDQYGCLTWFNDFIQRHNEALRQEVARLQSRNPAAKVVYADYYGAAMVFLRAPQGHGIDDPLVACCVGDGRYHTGRCDKDTKIWGSPAKYASWDGVHMTEKAYRIIANEVLFGPFADTPMAHIC
ncbi:unnamed protein product [Alopecurus aequalis]